MYELKEILSGLSVRFNIIKKGIDIPGKQERILLLEALSTSPDFWTDKDTARDQLQELADLNKTIIEINDIEESIKTVEELLNDPEFSSELTLEVKRITKELNELEKALYLSGKYDKKNAVLSIHAGQGGTEAMDWTSMLYRMYTRFFERRNWKYTVLELNSGEEAGIKSVTVKVLGLNAYGYLKGEVGAHRLVRQSPFNADSLRQTSFARVEVLPELTETDAADIDIKDEDLDWQFYRASGNGGQNVNKVSTAVRLTHIPTGIVVTSQIERYQEKNRKHALDQLRSKLWILERAKEKNEVNSIKGEYRPASWGTQIRSYVLHPYKMVKDVRTKIESSNPEAVLDGDMDEFIEAELRLEL